jgi:predicted amidohydrolase YtcJ
VRAASSARAPGQWVIGRGWDHAEWGQWPTAHDLDAVAPNHPVALTRKDGHVVWLNSAALLAVGIGDDTPDPPGGEIVRSAGRASGIVKENAIQLVTQTIPEPAPDARQAAMVDAWPEAWCRGLTGCHDMGFRDTALFRDLSTLRDSGELGLRFVWYFPEGQLDEAVGLGLQSGRGDEWLRVGGLKLYLDGTLGAQTAHLLEPYEGQARNTGLVSLDPDRFADLVSRAADAGIATAVHAIGDAANRVALDGFARAAVRAHRADRSLHLRIEHAQLLHPDDVGRFASLGVIASMQPIHATVDMPEVERWWGARSRYAYAWRTLLDQGACLAFGSDAPIETLDVFAGVHAAVTRQTTSGQPAGGWHPELALTVPDAVRAYTLGAAVASGQDDRLGTLEVGKYADLIVLDRDPFTVAPSALPNVTVQGTMIDGVWVWQAPTVDFAGPRPVG